jgi:hypothetical protein
MGKGSDDLIPTGVYYTYWTAPTFPMALPASDKTDFHNRDWAWNFYVRWLVRTITTVSSNFYSIVGSFGGSWYLGDVGGPVRSTN